LLGKAESGEKLGEMEFLAVQEDRFLRKWDRIIGVWELGTGGCFVWWVTQLLNAKVCRSRGILNFVRRVFAQVVVSRWLAWGCILCARQGSHFLAAKVLGIARSGGEKRRDVQAVTRTGSRKMGSSFVISKVIRRWLSAFSQSLGLRSRGWQDRGNSRKLPSCL